MAHINPFAKWLTNEVRKRNTADKEISNQSGLNSGVIREIRSGERYPTSQEISLLKRCFPSLQHQKALIAHTVEQEAAERTIWNLEIRNGMSDS
jgi:hypothetical protein